MFVLFDKLILLWPPRTVVALWSTQGGSGVNFKGGLPFTNVSNMYGFKVIGLVPNLATRACGGTVVYWVVSRVNFKGVLIGYQLSICLLSICIIRMFI